MTTIRYRSPEAPPTPCDHEHLQELSQALAGFSRCHEGIISQVEGCAWPRC